MPGLMLAAVTPDNTPHGYNWTFAFPMLLFIAIALVLYLLLSRPHRRVPGRPISVIGGAGAQVSASESAAADEPADGSADGGQNKPAAADGDGAEAGE